MEETQGKNVVKVRLEGTDDAIKIVGDLLQKSFWLLDRSRAYPNRGSNDIKRQYIVVFTKLSELPQEDVPF